MPAFFRRTRSQRSAHVRIGVRLPRATRGLLAGIDAPLLLSLASRPGQLPALLRLGLDARAASSGLRSVRARLDRGMAMPAHEQARCC